MGGRPQFFNNDGDDGIIGVPEAKMTTEKKRGDAVDEFLKVVGFKKGELVDRLQPHVIPGTDTPCTSETGTVVNVTISGAVAYVKCGGCGDILREEL